jgi:hypothetical protein
MDISLAPSGKFLPVLFARGYINALWLPSRTEVWRDYYRSAVGRFVPAAKRDHWLHLLDPYLTEAEEASPLDYTVLRILHANMLDDGVTERHRMQQIAWIRTAPTGEAWWVGCTPLDKHQDYGLQRLLASHIQARIDQESDGKLYRQQAGTASAILAMQSFIESFASEGGIAITAEVESQQIMVIINDCPFCVQHPNCRVFWGVVVGFLDWLHKAKTVSETRRRLQLNKAASTAHRVVVDLLE